MKNVQNTEAYQVLKRQIASTIERVRKVKPDDAAELEALIRMMESALGGAPDVGKFTRFRKAIEAVEAYLKEIGHPVNRMEIADEVLKGGFAPEANDRKWLVIDTIKYHSTKENPRLLHYGDDMYGLPEWSSEFGAKSTKQAKARKR